jgi:subtilase family serine protease
MILILLNLSDLQVKERIIEFKNLLYLFLIVVLLGSLSLTGTVAAASPHDKGNTVGAKPVCPGPAARGNVRCIAWARPNANSSPIGLTPAVMKAAYGFSTSNTAGAGKTIALVDAYNDPTAANDLSVFSKQFGLPACTTANGCFKKVNQTGGTSYPSSNAGWALEISLDIEWAHAIAPGAKILLVEAKSSSFTNLLAAENYASAHASYVSNSWGGSEFSGESSYDSNFMRSGMVFFFAAGDSGLPADYPSAPPNVISVGGTLLTFNTNGSLASETGWADGGGGCSSYETAASAQSSYSGYAQVACAGMRATPDVSLDAAPNSGAAVYDSTKYGGQSPLLSNRYESIQELAESQESDIVAETIDVPDVCLPS